MSLAALLLSLLCLWLPAGASAKPELTIEPANRISGTPLKAEVTLEGLDRRLPAMVFLDGKTVGETRLSPGANTLLLEDVLLTAGPHELELRAGTTVAAAQFRTLPGWLSILPPLLAIGLALISKDVIASLFLGVFGGAMILESWNPFAAFGRTIDRFIVPSLADVDHMSIVVFTLLLGAMVGLITKSGGTQGIVARLQPYATDSRRGQVATWLMGVMIFFDDYANTLIVGPTMRPITDRLKISREKLAYIVDSTAAPVVCLFPISTWVGFELGLIQDAFSQLGLPFDAYGIFLQSIPYRFYPILALLLVLTLAWTGFDFGPMAKAQRRAREKGLLLAEDAVPIADYSSHEVTLPEGTDPRARNALIPIFTVVSVTLIGLYLSGSGGKTRAAGTSLGAWLREVFADANSFHALLWASLAGALVALGLALGQRILSLRQGIEAAVGGMKSMLIAILVLSLAWAIGAVCGELQTAEFLVALVKNVVAPTWLPALTFLLAAGIAFATGSSWGTMAILEPLVIPICHNLATAAGLATDDRLYGVLMASSIASVLAGSVWGDHCSPISDTTILSSMATGCDHIAHVRTQIPYALTTGILAIFFGSLPTAHGLSPWISLVTLATLIVCTVLLLGRRGLAQGRTAE